MGILGIVGIVAGLIFLAGLIVRLAANASFSAAVENAEEMDENTASEKAAVMMRRSRWASGLMSTGALLGVGCLVALIF